jgi:hypothetical protein
MTEEQIRDGYERLDSALHAPMDALDRVERRMRARRRRRRAGIGVGAAVVVAAIGGYVAVSAGGSDDGREGLVGVDTPPDSLVMTRPDGSTYAFEDITVTCDAPSGEGVGEVGGRHLLLTSPRRLDGERLLQPFVMIEADVAELDGPRTFTLPVESADGSSESLPMTVFVADTEGAPDGNEVVSSTGSTGTVRVTRASCDPTPVLELELDVTLASEEQAEDGQMKQSLDLAGIVR